MNISFIICERESILTNQLVMASTKLTESQFQLHHLELFDLIASFFSNSLLIKHVKETPVQEYRSKCEIYTRYAGVVEMLLKLTKSRKKFYQIIVVKAWTQDQIFLVFTEIG